MRAPSPDHATPPHALAYVLQRHDATRLHYDLRLEWRGVMKSWAVTLGPSLDPADRRLAIAVEDHPLAWNAFEGVIPAGEYGAGTVQIYDRGTWVPDAPDRVDADLAAGKLGFTLHGARLRGGFALVRMPPREEDRRQESWLLIKKNDAWARPGAGDAALADPTSVVSGRTLAAIAADAPPRRRRAQGGGGDGSAAAHGPGRVIWPVSDGRPALTRGDLLRYIEAYADRLLRHIARRPLTMLRAPGGIDGHVFLQRHAMKGMPAVIREIDLTDDTCEPYVYIEGVAGLLALVRLHVVEFHPWGATVDALNTPDRLTFDLDPDAGLDFGRVVSAAGELKQRLEAAGLAPFLKSTGGKGLHVVVPLDARAPGAAGWPAAKAFARNLCATMAADSPDRYTLTLAKKARGGRIFLDYLRNDRTASAIAPWSPRARAGAPVAVPLAWSALDAGLRPGGRPLASLLDAPVLPDSWAGFEAAAVRLPDLKPA